MIYLVPIALDKKCKAFYFTSIQYNWNKIIHEYLESLILLYFSLLMSISII